MEKPENPIIGELPAEPITIERALNVELIKRSGIRLFQTDPETFFEFLNRVYQQKTSGTLDNSVAACVGGMFRSSAINEALCLLDVEVPVENISEKVNKGIDIESLRTMIREGQIDADDRLIPKGFSGPLKTLFLGLDMRFSETENLFVLLLTIAWESAKVGRQVNLDIVVINTEDENDITGPARELRDLIKTGE